MSKEGQQQSVVQSENPKTTGILQRVRSGEEGDRSKEERSSFSESRFQADLATIPVRAVRPMIQAKLTVGPANDRYEQEADRVAAQVVQRIHSPVSNSLTQGESVQRKEEDDELQLKPIAAIQRLGMSAEGGEVSSDLESEINRARGGGQALAPELQAKMGEAMGADFSGVRVHRSEQADKLTRAVGARAFTTGQDLFFKQGEYQPGSRGGQELIAHELTHTIQQSKENIKRSPLIQCRRANKTEIETAIANSSLNYARNSFLSLYNLTYRHHNDELIYLQAPQQGVDTEATFAQYWYRVLTEKEFDVLNRNNRFHGDSYGGIAPSRTYVHKYFTNESLGNYIVEFRTPEAGFLYNLFASKGPKWNIKAEGGGTFGLGPTGNANGEAGALFNKLLAKGVITWELIELKIPNREPEIDD